MINVKSVIAPVALFLLLVSCVGFIEGVPDRSTPDYSRSDRASTLPDGDYRSSCSNCSVVLGDLSCWCKDRAGFDRTTSISLRGCRSRISNDDGRLVCGHAKREPAQQPLPFGTYKDTCSNCSMAGSVLRCSCTNMSGYSQSSSLETRYCKKGISNDDGRLVCGSVAPKPVVKPLPYGSYKDSCSNCSMYGSVLSCSCKDANNLSRSSSLETQFCNSSINNDNGRLVCGNIKTEPKSPKGSYTQSCKNCQVQTSLLSCQCQDGNGIFRPTNINFSHCYKSIENCDGRLNCGGC